MFAGRFVALSSRLRFISPKFYACRFSTVKINFINTDGSIIEANAKIGDSILEVAHNHGVGLEGACESSLACRYILY